MNQWLSPTLMRDLGWTLVHFLWEGLAIAALLAAALYLFKNRAAHFKYLAGCAALALMALAPAATFVFVAQQNESSAISSAPTNYSWAAGDLPPRPFLRSWSPPRAMRVPPVSHANWKYSSRGWCSAGSPVFAGCPAACWPAGSRFAACARDPRKCYRGRNRSSRSRGDWN
jgi:hypothetical protein